MQPGTSAPSFTALAYSSILKKMGNVDLASLHGKYTVLFFYPADFGPLVLADMMGLQEAASELMEDDVNMLAISTDTVESHKAFAELRQEEVGLQGLHCILLEDKTGDI